MSANDTSFYDNALVSETLKAEKADVELSLAQKSRELQRMRLRASKVLACRRFSNLDDGSWTTRYPKVLDCDMDGIKSAISYVLYGI